MWYVKKGKDVGLLSCITYDTSGHDFTSLPPCQMDMIHFFLTNTAPWGAYTSIAATTVIPGVTE